MNFSGWWLRHLLWNCPNINVTGLHWSPGNIGSGNGLVPSGNKPLPEPMLTQISVAIWCHLATMCNILWPEHCGCYFADHICKYNFSMKIILIWFMFHWGLFLRAQSLMCLDWFRLMAWRQIGNKPLHAMNGKQVITWTNGDHGP